MRYGALLKVRRKEYLCIWFLNTGKNRVVQRIKYNWSGDTDGLKGREARVRIMVPCSDENRITYLDIRLR